MYVENDAGEVSRSQLEPDIYVGIDQAATDAQFKEVMDDVADGYRYLQRWTDDDGGFCCRFVPETQVG